MVPLCDGKAAGYRADRGLLSVFRAGAIIATIACGGCQAKPEFTDNSRLGQHFFTYGTVQDEIVAVLAYVVGPMILATAGIWLIIYVRYKYILKRAVPNQSFSVSMIFALIAYLIGSFPIADLVEKGVLDALVFLILVEQVIFLPLGWPYIIFFLPIHIWYLKDLSQGKILFPQYFVFMTVIFALILEYLFADSVLSPS
jgi:hypothetical protein